MTEPSLPSRRQFLTGRAIQQQIGLAGEQFVDALTGSTGREMPTSGPTLRLGKQAMACDFDIILNPGPAARWDAASAALDLIDLLEDQLSIYRPDSEISGINAAAGNRVTVETRLYQLLALARQVSQETDGAYDITSGPLIRLWRRCRAELRLPTADEIAVERRFVGMQKIEFSDDDRSLQLIPGMELNLGSIGKGYALDRAAEVLVSSGVSEFLLHGGRSSLLAKGSHNRLPGWPVGIANPHFPDRTLATVLLSDAGLSTSGANIQYFRLEGRRYGHILDPRTGWPADELASCTVIAPSAALAEALSTAFFVIGVENARQYCHNHPEIKALLIPVPKPGRQLELVNCGLSDEQLFVGEDVRTSDE